jgi:hypothetical protein
LSQLGVQLTPAKDRRGNELRVRQHCHADRQYLIPREIMRKAPFAPPIKNSQSDLRIGSMTIGKADLRIGSITP